MRFWLRLEGEGSAKHHSPALRGRQLMSSGHVSFETGRQSRSRPSRKTRSDAGTIKFQARDEYALTWIGDQYGIRLDHLQWLLGRDPGPKAAHTNWISESAARDVVKRW